MGIMLLRQPGVMCIIHNVWEELTKICWHIELISECTVFVFVFKVHCSVVVALIYIKLKQ